MVAEFAEHGVRFMYPENWTLEREANETGWTASVQSPGTAFLMISFHADVADVDALAQSVLEAMREEYPELEAGDCVDSLAGRPAIGHDIRFFSLDLTNTCRTRCIALPEGTLLVLSQVNDLEEDRLEPVLRAISVSLQVDAE